MTTYHKIANVHFENDLLVLEVDGKEIRADLKKISPLLCAASVEERENFEISPSGYGIHWPLIDEDISIDGLLGVVHSPSWSKKSA